MRIHSTRRGARILEAGTVLSEILAAPGPTHTLFDVLAATVAALSPGPRVAILGFAGGGLVAPLRAMGFPSPLRAVDLSLRGAAVFRRLSGRWAGTVRIDRDDAARWIGSCRGRFDLVLEDLFAPGPRGMEKPEVSFGSLPPAIRRRLDPCGVAVFNVLPQRGKRWADLLRPLAAPFSIARVVVLRDYENRLLIAGDELASARRISARLRSTLRAAGSRQAGRLAVRDLAR